LRCRFSPEQQIARRCREISMNTSAQIGGRFLLQVFLVLSDARAHQTKLLQSSIGELLGRG
jgi:hypothetical protein